MRLPTLSSILVLLCWSAAAHSHDVRVPAKIGELPLEQVSPGIYLVHAPLEAPKYRRENNSLFQTGLIV